MAVLRPAVESLRAMLEEEGIVDGWFVFQPFIQCWGNKSISNVIWMTGKLHQITINY